MFPILTKPGSCGKSRGPERRALLEESRPSGGQCALGSVGSRRNLTLMPRRTLDYCCRRFLSWLTTHVE
jgi:hypothetical protein